MTTTSLSDVSAAQLLQELVNRMDPELPRDYRIDPDDVIAWVWPLGGPYGSAETESAAGALYELVRYLNHATYNQDAIPYLSTADSVMGRLAAVAHALHQLVTQLAALIGSDPHRKSVYDADHRDDADLAVQKLLQWQEDLLAFAPFLEQAGEQLSKLQRSGLGNRTNTDNRLIDREGKLVR